MTAVIELSPELRDGLTCRRETDRRGDLGERPEHESSAQEIRPRQDGAVKFPHLIPEEEEIQIHPAGRPFRRRATTTAVRLHFVEYRE